MDNNTKEAVAILNEKVGFFLKEQAVTSDPAQRFELKKRIDETQSELAELTKNSTSVEVAVDNAKGVRVANLDAVAVAGFSRYYVGKVIDLSLREATLDESLHRISEFSGLQFVVPPWVNCTITIELKGVPWDQALSQILRLHYLGVEIDGQVARVAPVEMLREERRIRSEILRGCEPLMASCANSETEPGSTLADNSRDLFFWRCQRTYVGEPINISIENADLVETLRSFVEIGGFNMIVQARVNGAVTIELKRIPWDQVLAVILQMNHLGAEIDGRIVRILPIAEVIKR